MQVSGSSHRDVLSQVDAEARAARVSKTGYRLALDITPGSATYRGDVTIAFDLTGRGSLFLDYRGKTIERLEANGQVIAAPEWTGYRLTIPGDALREGANELHIVYENDYDHSGDGFHQFTDPEDGEEYLYTNFEPYESHRLFPQFDQPDIKASYSLTVTAPSHWELVANSRETGRTEAGGGRSTWTFETTKPFSTYLFALVAGPYQAFRDQHGEIPLGLYCRKSMAKYLDTAELFEITKQGLDFYADFFDFPYPFGKYDQLFVPEFNAGAMENVGCVTHNEFMVYRDPPTENQRRRRAEVVLHEMAHMWFGDLVTMRWWNDLWLNESFATFMSYLSMTSATRFTNGWQDFSTAIKNWAYRQDQLVTTHPIAAVVNDTEETFLNFDGITYGKGASVLKQLVAAIGMEGFREGMRHYFRTHAYSNATLAQFMQSLEAGSGQSLSEWSRAWLETPSLNTLGAQWEADGERVTRLALTQTAPEEYPTIRPHTLEIGLLRDADGSMEITSIPARITTTEVVIPEAEGKPKPSLVFPNYGDYAYAKVALDAESVAWVKGNIDRVDDTLLRQLLWSSLWNMTRDAQLKAQEFLELVNTRVVREPDITIVESVLGQASLALTRLLPDAWRPEQAHRLFETAWTGLQAATGDAQIIWARALVGAAETEADLRFAASLADGERVVEGLTIDQDMRWSLATKFVAYGLEGAEARLAAEVERDASDRGSRAKIAAEVSRPEAGAKAEAWNKFLGDGFGSFHLTRAAMGGFNWPHQRELLAPYYDRFFAEAPGAFTRDENAFAEAYFLTLFPRYRVDEETMARADRLMAEHGANSPLLTRLVKEANDELARALRCRRFAES